MYEFADGRIFYAMLCACALYISEKAKKYLFVFAPEKIHVR